jgi:short-subunit dehydrogenase
LFNNAGVAVDGVIWEQTLAEWEWVLGVNLWGVIHGIRTFVPIMLEQNVECHIVNTASVAGLHLGPGIGSYRVSKYGVITLSGTLYYELKRMGAKVKVSVLCPGAVSTRIMDAARNRPPELQDAPTQKSLNPDDQTFIQNLTQMVEAGMSPVAVADDVFEAIRKEAFYILPHPEVKDGVRAQTEDLIQNRNPT